MQFQEEIRDFKQQCHLCENGFIQGCMLINELTLTVGNFVICEQLVLNRLLDQEFAFCHKVTPCMFLSTKYITPKISHKLTLAR